MGVNDKIVYKGDVGVRINLYLRNTDINVSDVVSSKLVVKKSDGTVVDWILNQGTDDDGEDCLYYVSVLGDFDVIGNYRLQPAITTNNGSYRVKPFIIKVKDVI